MTITSSDGPKVQSSPVQHPSQDSIFGHDGHNWTLEGPLLLYINALAEGTIKTVTTSTGSLTPCHPPLSPSDAAEGRDNGKSRYMLRSYP